MANTTNTRHSPHPEMREYVHSAEQFKEKPPITIEAILRQAPCTKPKTVERPNRKGDGAVCLLPASVFSSNHTRLGWPHIHHSNPYVMANVVGPWAIHTSSKEIRRSNPNKPNPLSPPINNHKLIPKSRMSFSNQAKANSFTHTQEPKMTERSKRRAAVRKSRKKEIRAAARQQPTQTVEALTHQATAHSDPTHPTHLDPAEEANVEIAENDARYRELQLTQYLAKRTPISDAQLAANRANAQHSSGPVSELGKSISARNNLRHGLTQSDGELILLETESKDEYLASLAAFQREWKPATACENDLVNRLACHRWLRRRALKLQACHVSSHNGQIIDETNFALYHRYQVVHDRAYNKAFSDLLRLRTFQVCEKNGFESQQRKSELHQFKIQSLKHRETLQQFALRTAETRLALVQRKLDHPKPQNPLTKGEDDIIRE